LAERASGILSEGSREGADSSGIYLEDVQEGCAIAGALSRARFSLTDVPAITSVAIMIHEKYRYLGKPFVMELQGGYECNEAIIELRDHGIASFPSAEQAVNGIVALRKYFRIRERERQNLNPTEAKE
jgi:acyl-CoA synthetase (NDP forming)